MEITPQHEAAVIAALAYASMHWADPSELYEILRSFNPDGDWDSWITSVERARAMIQDNTESLVASYQADAS